ncbi:flagellar biosynthetic protein FliR [Paenibacillus shirakamiensis]|uniref:Flagellar biosynthetic protein FliR n=2 Tax=Paenibacillus shirakamiensis TaxID=1265935 RepID=A0ABS4JKH1_9BACL|nr:flagellar biosynthetic protein FliR [Paenibacillus shirakamiensis]
MLLQNFSIFMLIFCRITAFFVVSPVFSSKSVPSIFKIGLSAMIAFMIYLVQGVHQTIPPDLGYVILMFREILIGLLMGYVALLIFSVIQMAGAFIDIQIGFSIANVLDPMTGASAPIISNFKYMVATLVFLSINGHHYLLQAVMRSYEWIPLSNNFFVTLYNGSISEFVLRTFSQAFLLAFQMSAPLVVSLFLTDVALGFLARTAPQFNVFVIGIPLKIIVGLLMLMLLLPSFVYAFEYLFQILFKSLENLMGTIGQRPK